MRPSVPVLLLTEQQMQCTTGAVALRPGTNVPPGSAIWADSPMRYSKNYFSTWRPPQISASQSQNRHRNRPLLDMTMRLFLAAVAEAAHFFQPPAVVIELKSSLAFLDVILEYLPYFIRTSGVVPIPVKL